MPIKLDLRIDEMRKPLRFAAVTWVFFERVAFLGALGGQDFALRPIPALTVDLSLLGRVVVGHIPTPRLST